MYFRIHFQVFVAAAILVASGDLCGQQSSARSEPVPDSATQHQVDFDRDIQPLLSDRCYHCHGPDDARREADLRLDQKESAFDVIEPGDPDSSELIRRIESEDEDERMPPPDLHLELSDHERALLRAWVEQGATWRDHWSFVPVPAKVEVPEIPNDDWSRNEIDRFVLARLREMNIVPAPEASPERLLRRVTFDLTGLPPTPEELDAFLSDPEPDAYRRAVERLWASPAFAERMASDWLDAARYSDTYGYQVDRDRFVWPWRDWLIRAIDRNMPYDQFLVEQIAGDLLPDATDDQILATTFNRLHPQKVEGGSVPEEFRIEYVCDRIETVAVATMGLTLGCARCHDHKFDPITQREYFQLFAFFDDIDEAGLYSFFTNAVPTPTLFLWDEAQKRQRDVLAQAVRDMENHYRAVAESRGAEFQQWFESMASTEEIELPIPGELDVPPVDQLDLRGNTTVDGPGDLKAVQFTGDDEVNLSIGNFRRFEPFSIGAWVWCPDHKDRAVIFHRSRAWTDAASRGYELLILDGHLQAALIHFWPGNALAVKTDEPLPLGKWVHVAWVYDGSNRAAGLRLYLNGKPASTTIVRDHLQKNITGGGGDNITWGARFRDRGFTGGRLAGFRVFHRELSELEVRELAVPGQWKDVRTRALAGNEEALELLRDYYLRGHDSKVAEAWERLKDARAVWCEFYDRSQEIMVMRDRPQPRTAYVLERGQYDQRREEVAPQTPAFLPPMHADGIPNRLDLARWLVSDDHPLTSRVAVNRIWQMIFGAGLVRTQEDFGRQGSPPSHPELLDWLARDFMEHGWDVKRLVRQIVLSSTYRQDSQTLPEFVARDPDNVWLGRASVYRLPAEMLRDNALSVSGLLVSKIGGPPVRPYDLKEAFRPVNPESGEGLYRRSLYTYWIRTDPSPVMLTMDAAQRDVCTMRRERTASPLQGLVMMNGPQFVEAARALAWRVMEQSPDHAERARRMFRCATSRFPSESELAAMLDLTQRMEQHYRDHPDEADQLCGVGQWQPDSIPESRREWAAWTILATTLLNHDECITRR